LTSKPLFTTLRLNEYYYSSCFKLALSPFKKQILNGTTNDIGMSFKNFWLRPLVQQGWIAVQQNVSLKSRRLNQAGLQVQRWGKLCIEW
jgi:hypothetical protein